MKKYFLLLVFSCLVMTAQQQKTAFAYFDFDSDALTEDATATLGCISDELKGATAYTIKVYGFTDDAGTDSYNSILAQKRADRVAAYFQLHGFLITEAGVDSPELRSAPLPAEKKRRVRIEYVYMPLVVCGFQESTVSRPEVKGIEGTKVSLSGGLGTGEVAVSEFFSTESMIANGMFGIAEGGDILKSDGMITICNSYKQIDSSGLYTIEIPAYRGVLNGKSTVWLSDKKENGLMIWKETSIEIATDSVANTYTIKLGARPQECTHINLDMFASKANGYRVVYLYTDKPYDLATVKMYHGLSAEVPFSAKLNDTTYAFSVPLRASLTNLKFTGHAKGGPRQVGVQLRKCRHKVDKKRNHHYYITAKAIAAGLPMEEEDQPKGWFGKGGWFSRLFS